MKLPQVPLLTPTRRELLQMMGAGAAWLALPTSCVKKAATPYQYQFLTSEQVSALNALANAVIPADNQPGGGSLGVAEYADRFLTSLEGNGPLYGGGPYSGRAPYPSSTGTPSSKYPPDNFSQALPIDRVSEAHFKLFILGSAGVPGGAPNDSLGTIPGMRTTLTNVLATAMGLSKTSLSSLSQADVQAVFSQLDGNSQVLLINLVSEACFAPPEYGGNKNLQGWAIANFEGDQQPVGFSWFNPQTNTYTDDPKYPVTTANPGTDPAPIDSTTTNILNTLFNLPAGFAFSLSKTF